MPSRIAESLRRMFWLLPAVGLVGGAACAYLLVELDRYVDVNLGVFYFTGADAAYNALSTLATAMLSVAGVAFSVTLVALQLSSSQLSPRVLTTFREDTLTQATLGAFLFVFIYAIVLTGRLQQQEGALPEVALTFALVATLIALGMFVAFLGRTVASLQASTVIKRIAEDGRRAVRSAHPTAIGSDPDDAQASAREVAGRRAAQPAYEVRARRAGYLLHIDGQELMRKARKHDALVVQQAMVGDLIVTGQVVARAHLEASPDDGVLEDLEEAFAYGEERRMVSDVAFPIRALADVALRGLSPSLNDPTTAENALGSVTDTIIAWLNADHAHPIRVDGDGTPRLVASSPHLDDLVRLGFEQARLMVEGVAGEHPLLAERVIAWLQEIERRSREVGREGREVGRLIALLDATDDDRGT